MMLYELDNAHDLRLAAKVCDRWCYFGGSSKQTENKTATTTYDPTQVALRQQNLTDTQNRLGSVGPYSGELTAGFNPTQTQAQGILTGIGTDPSYGQNYGTALDVNRGVLGANINPNITAGQLSNTDLKPYMDPYTQDVINSSLARLTQQRGVQQISDNNAAVAAKAFGGTRQAVQNGITSGQYDLNSGQLIAGLNDQNFNQARSAAQYDIGNRLTADQNTFGNTLGLNQFKLGAANNLASLSDAQLANNTRQAGILGAVGDAQQQQQQLGDTNSYNAYLQEFNRQLAQQQAYNQALGLIPIGTTQNENGTTTTSSNPGIGGILGGIGSLGLAAATGGSSLGLTAGLGGLSGLFGNSLRGQTSGPQFGYS